MAADILQATARALEVMQTYCLQAQSAVESCDRTTDQLADAATQLAAIQNELGQQFLDSVETVKQLEARRLALEARAERQSARIEGIEEELGEVLRRMGEQAIDPRLLAGPGGESKRVMLDFVDAEALEGVREQARGHLAALRLPLAEARVLCERLGAALREADAACGQCGRPPRALSAEPALPARQMPELQAMLGALLAVARQHDRLLYGLRRGEPAAAGEEAEARAAELPERVAKCYGALQRVLAAAAEAQARAARYSADHGATTAAHAALAALGERAAEAGRAVERAEGEVAAREGPLAACAEELGDLCGWYARAHAACGQLAGEVQRRRAEAARAAAAVERCRAELEALHAAEAGRRAAFEAAYGRYLPASLCPAIHAPAPRYTLLSDPPDPPLPALEPSPAPPLGTPRGVPLLGQRESFRLAAGAATRLALASTPTNAPSDPAPAGEGI